MFNPCGWVDPLGLAGCNSQKLKDLYKNYYKDLRSQGFTPKEAKELGEWFSRSRGKADVYLRSNAGSSKIDYVGISKNIPTRYSPTKFSANNITPKQLPRNQARSIEQAVINARRGAQNNPFTNIQNSISPNRAHYDAAVKWGENWLKQNGYGHLLNP
ncbi:hypothetical protein HYE60_00010 [Aggregatibacter actinomycetemcomitans]|nr:hypothetical protein [Aggregatibacter actinomycetemcomitans]